MNEGQTPLYMLYPFFRILDDGRFIPSLYLPENYLEMVPKFYALNGKAGIERYAESLLKEFRGRHFGVLEIRLKWDENLGLTSIDLGSRSALDLNERKYAHFQEHNLGVYDSIVGTMVATKYISELLKSGS